VITLEPIGYVRSARRDLLDDDWDAVPATIELGARHPRGNPRWPRVGVFAQRAKDRSNRLGVTVVAITGREGRTLRVSGLDAVDGTPAEFLPRGAIRQPAWSHKLMQAYWNA